MALDLIAIRRDLHQHPETAFEEHRTAQVIEGHLHDLGLTTRRVAGTGVIAEICGAAGPGPTIALRADIDALPLSEQTGLPYASCIPGRMHACGHDVHTAIGLGVAERLLRRRAELRGRVRFLFQPAEEVTLGARAMVEAGALAGVSAIFGLHNQPALPTGTVAVKPGPLFAASDRFAVTIHGTGGHGAYPHLAADPLVAAAAVLTALQTAVSRSIDPLDPAVVSVCRLAGGTTFNVIPDRAELEGTVRCYAPAVRQAMAGLLTAIAQGVAAGHRCRAEVAYQHLVPAVWNDADAAALVATVAKRVLGPARVQEAAMTMAAEDFAVYQQHLSGCFFWLGSAGPHGLHHPAYAVDEACIETGAALLTEVALTATATAQAL